jgi:hypothetical protein
VLLLLLPLASVLAQRQQGAAVAVQQLLLLSVRFVMLLQLPSVHDLLASLLLLLRCLDHLAPADTMHSNSTEQQQQHHALSSR